MTSKDSVLLHAQLDIVMLLEFALGVRDTYDSMAVIATLTELMKFTGDSAGKQLLEIEEVQF